MFGITHFSGFGSGPPPPTDYNVATGGDTVATDGDFKVHTFTSSGTFSISSVGTVNSDIQLLLIGGGGSGGKAHQSGG